MEYIGSKGIKVYAINVITLIHDVASGVGTRVQVIQNVIDNIRYLICPSAFGMNACG